jgi:hypothetical protein
VITCGGQKTEARGGDQGRGSMAPKSAGPLVAKTGLVRRLVTGWGENCLDLQDRRVHQGLKGVYGHKSEGRPGKEGGRGRGEREKREGEGEREEAETMCWAGGLGETRGYRWKYEQNRCGWPASRS